jgi:hypothetical protein
MKKLLLVLAAVFAMSCGAFVDDSVPIAALTVAGYSEASCQSSHWILPEFYGCSEEDDTAFKCIATNPKGVRVNVTVCSNFMFKGSTIRHN